MAPCRNCGSRNTALSDVIFMCLNCGHHEVNPGTSLAEIEKSGSREVHSSRIGETEHTDVGHTDTGTETGTGEEHRQ